MFYLFFFCSVAAATTVARFCNVLIADVFRAHITDFVGVRIAANAVSAS